jgi:hypothetical protein
MNALVAVNWQPELRGILIVIIAVSVLCGSIYLILLTNLGARLGFLVAFAGLAGWVFALGAMWWIYGIGLVGSAPTWDGIPGKTVLQNPAALSEAGALTTTPTFPDGTSYADQAFQVDGQFVTEGWRKLAESDTAFGQAGSSAGTYLTDTGAFGAGEFRIVNVFDRGGERHPVLFDGKVDFLAFFHDPHHVVVEVAPLVTHRSEPGRAPAAAEVDQTRPHQYVYMVRNLGQRRVPAAIVCLSALLVFLCLCYLLHTRDRRAALNRAAPALPAGA